MMGRLTILCLGAVLLAMGCKPVPTAPDGETPDVRDRTYTNTDWGFSITPLDSLWSISAFQFFGPREPNGLSPVEVIIRRASQGSLSRPTLILSSFGSSETEQLEAIADGFEGLFESNFDRYSRLGERSMGTVAGVASIEWSFRAREPQSGVHFGNGRYLTVIFARGDQIYTVVCSGSNGNFPDADFRSTLGTFQFQ